MASKGGDYSRPGRSVCVIGRLPNCCADISSYLVLLSTREHHDPADIGKFPGRLRKRPGLAHHKSSATQGHGQHLER